MNAAMEDPVLTALRNFMERELGMQREKYSTRAAGFRAAAKEAHADWRLGCIPPRWGDAGAMIFRECMADIIRMRLWIA